MLICIELKEEMQLLLLLSFDLHNFWIRSVFIELKQISDANYLYWQHMFIQTKIKVTAISKQCF